MKNLIEFLVRTAIRLIFKIKTKVELMDDMFNACHKFNQDISKWNVSKVVSMERIFSACHEFNQNLDSWKIKEDCDTESAFNFCRSLVTKPKWYIENED